MSKRRAVSSHNVNSKRQKTGKEVVALLEREKAEQQQKDLNYILETLKGDPDRIPAVLSVLRLDTPAGFDASTHIPPDYVKRSFTRLPNKFLTEFFEHLEAFGGVQLKRMIKANNKCLVQILQRLCIIPPTMTIWTNEKSILVKCFEGRMNSLQLTPSLIHVQDDDTIDWTSSGIFQLLPIYDKSGAVEESDHIYKEIKCGSLVASLKTFLIVTAAWAISMNWSLVEATLVCPQDANVAPKCTSFFQQGMVADLMEKNSGGLPLAMSSSAKQQLSIEDGSPEAKDSDGHKTSDGKGTGICVTPSKSKSIDVGTSGSPSSTTAGESVTVSPPPVLPSKAAAARRRLLGKQ